MVLLAVMSSSGSSSVVVMVVVVVLFETGSGSAARGENRGLLPEGRFPDHGRRQHGLQFQLERVQVFHSDPVLLTPPQNWARIDIGWKLRK